ncbi:MAG: hypothetical protein Q7R52_03475 [archaeon]|nr:hypothetical protein [archaeon]
MLENTSESFRAFFLIEFTNQLVENSQTPETIFLRKVLRDRIKRNLEKKENEEKLYELVAKKDFYLPSKRINEETREYIPKKRFRLLRPGFLKMPESRLPSTVGDLRPFPLQKEIDLGKLNPLVKDRSVKTIICDEAGKNITIKRVNNEARVTSIFLSNEEIEDIIKRFADATKMPAEEGVFRAVYGNLIISAIISHLAGIKFTLTKMSMEI